MTFLYHSYSTYLTAETKNHGISFVLFQLAFTKNLLKRSVLGLVLYFCLFHKMIPLHMLAFLLVLLQIWSYINDLDEDSNTSIDAVTVI